MLLVGMSLYTIWTVARSVVTHSQFDFGRQLKFKTVGLAGKIVS